ncbi:MAG TPA: SDR family oxidoreductase [Stellaceae bacterium]|nr:SDR family oxidoreductase [Stellaceae bacterium]
MSRPHLVCFGLGYVARELAARVAAEGWTVSGTSRDGAPIAGYETCRFTRGHRLPASAFAGVTHILVSVPPDAAGDAVLDVHGGDIAAVAGLRWLGYLSTTGVYGDRGGACVDEAAELRPGGERGRRRVAAERGWLDLWRARGVPAHVFRLAGIYGPGRGPFEQLRAGTARRIDRPGHVFSRIHVDDLATVLAASIAQPHPGAVYNVCDDEPAAPADVIAYAAGLLGVAPPPLVPFAAADLSEMAQSFWVDNKRVSNALIKSELGIRLRYPDYRAGLTAILAAERRPPGSSGRQNG